LSSTAGWLALRARDPSSSAVVRSAASRPGLLALWSKRGSSLLCSRCESSKLSFCDSFAAVDSSS
jgi:hypothetical protein